MSSIRIERLEERWFSFRRIYCMEGSIDVWQGDQADDPNNEDKSWINLNSSSTFFRLNGEDRWIHATHLRGIQEDVYAYWEGFSAKDLWYMAMLRSILRVVPKSKEYCSRLLEEHGSVEAVLEWWATNKK